MQAQLSESCQPTAALHKWSAPDLARLGLWALREEALLTPKPGLVDRHGNGAHHDMTLALMLASANALGPWFQSIAKAASGRRLSPALREELGALGRAAEVEMLSLTGGVNTHRGAIWALGLLIAGCAAMGGSIEQAVAFAADLAAMPDRFAGSASSHGTEVWRRFGIAGAKQEACDGFPHVLRYGVPAVQQARRTGASEQESRIMGLLAIMATLDDTCLVYRAGPSVLDAAKHLAAKAYRLHGLRTVLGRACIAKLDGLLCGTGASPGGSADLLAATLFLDRYSSSAAPGTLSSGRPAPCMN